MVLCVCFSSVGKAFYSKMSHVLCNTLLFTIYRNIPELQEQNQRLLMVIRDLSEQQEQREQEMMDETLAIFVTHQLLCTLFSTVICD